MGVFSGFSGSDPDILAVPDSGKKSLIRIRNTAQNEHDLIRQLFKIMKPVKDRDAPKNSPPTILVRGVCGAEYLLIHILLQCGQFGGCHDE